MTAQEAQARAIRETGGTSANAIWSFEVLYGTDGGTLLIEHVGHFTPAIPFPLSALNLKAALEALPSIGAGGAKVSGSRVGPYKIEIVGDNSGQDIEPIFVDGINLNPTQEIEVVVESEGFSNDYATDAALYWNEASDAKSETHRFLLVKLALIKLRLGESSDYVDTSTGTNNRVDRKDSQRVENLRSLKIDVETDIAAEIEKLQKGRNRTWGGVMGCRNGCR